MNPTYEQLQAENSALKLQNAGLVGALKFYGIHDCNCKYPAHEEHEDSCYRSCVDRKEGQFPCTCGLDKFLTSSDPKQEEAILGVVNGVIANGEALLKEVECYCSEYVAVPAPCERCLFDEELTKLKKLFPHLKGPKV